MTTISKTLLKLFIDETLKLHKLEDRLNDAFCDLNYDNQVMRVLPDSYTDMVFALLQLNNSDSSWVSWWMYEDTKGVSDTTGCMDLETFDEFYAFVFEAKTVAEIQNAKSSSVFE